MAKVTPEAINAIANAFKSRTVKRYDISENVTTVSRVTYDDKGRIVASKNLGSIKHG